ncbi:unnamed protein product [Dibothriocephalus latus]|uniref:PIH1 N-terminal domain-containing protein n=1 Tax=Dibothriocephalus latus TaxID=60516 RepID=A0A3P7M3W2_DIBLA|nr:unnamed protein product [Dibothriocephalus latus]
MEKRLEDLKLTPGEVERLQKAFKDPEFCKLFAEYAEEISNPENRKRYEEEIKLAEQGRGMDVEFIHPTPCYVLKTRHWPSVSGPPKVKQHFEDAPPLADGQKVFINICSSDKVGKPEFVTDAQTCGDGPKNGVRWSIPHSFSPPLEDLDKDKKRCLGVTQKGPLRPTIIRRKRTDYEECQQRTQEEEQAAFEAARMGPNPKASVAALAKLKASSKEMEQRSQKIAQDTVDGRSPFIDTSSSFCGVTPYFLYTVLVVGRYPLVSILSKDFRKKRWI